jgi:hypothetical protein
MTDSPHRACPHPGDRTGARTRPPTTTPRTTTQPFLRREQHAPHGVGVKDLRPLRGWANGPIFDPDALTRRTQNLPEKPKRKITTPTRGLTGPDPSGMTSWRVGAE